MRFLELHVIFISVWNFGIRLGYASQFQISRLKLYLDYHG